MENGQRLTSHTATVGFDATIKHWLVEVNIYLMLFITRKNSFICANICFNKVDILS